MLYCHDILDFADKLDKIMSGKMNKDKTKDKTNKNYTQKIIRK